MILNIIIFIILMLLELLTFLSYPGDIWPDAVYNAIDYFFENIYIIDLIIPAPTVFSAILFMFEFIAIMIVFLLAKKFINWIRGSGEI